RAVTAAEAETLFRSQRQEVERVRTVRSALLQRYRARALSERDVQSAIARQTGQRLEVRADRDAVRCLVTAEQLECMRLIVRTAALPDEIQDVIRIREIEAGGATDGRAARADASLNAVQPREHVGPLHLPSVRHALAYRDLERLVALHAVDRDVIAAIGMEERILSHILRQHIVERQRSFIAAVA